MYLQCLKFCFIEICLHNKITFSKPHFAFDDCTLCIYEFVKSAVMKIILFSNEIMLTFLLKVHL